MNTKKAKLILKILNKIYPKTSTWGNIFTLLYLYFCQPQCTDVNVNVTKNLSKIQ